MENRVYLKIHDFDCSIEEISRLLGVEPTISWLPGDIIPNNRKKIERRTSSWQLIGSVDSKRPINEHIDFMINFVDSKSEIIAQLLKKYEGEFSIVGKYRKKEEFNFGAYLNANSLRVLAKVGLNIDMDIYFLSGI